MPRIAGVDVPGRKRGVIALTSIFGIGNSRAEEILERVGLDQNTYPDEWTEDETRRVRTLIEDTYVVEGSLRTETQLNIKRLMDIGCYRGLRHRRSLPVRGQRTKTNARTRKGRKKTVAGKKKAPRK
ncbi:30S ribosomal protein S13 [Rubrivirga sp. SAORIC476]|uniref:30S ribosomal protein S13 n=1 Tax=Rubrivirga sp. SAORIC476 TaxID=1961794 RepID=UPI000BA94510|nr:30S ribosomal protein S13 [Rubrivirga sp. SAORIC476]MAQ95769.1 30S ribosomal protein S13 [Rhodothermaceae bacterium]MBC12687.1 30S ribosomal protein S13 [Rhodothermaceae bacterium]PAP74919.1 30S ribosomal protein S13 [Rubrivirga sp. SAORIC476]